MKNGLPYHIKSNAESTGKGKRGRLSRKLNNLISYYHWLLRSQ